MFMLVQNIIFYLKASKIQSCAKVLVMERVPRAM